MDQNSHGSKKTQTPSSSQTKEPLTTKSGSAKKKSFAPSTPSNNKIIKDLPGVSDRLPLNPYKADLLKCAFDLVASIANDELAGFTLIYQKHNMQPGLVQIGVLQRETLMKQAEYYRQMLLQDAEDAKRKFEKGEVN